jgi:hypothetical protein
VGDNALRAARELAAGLDPSAAAERCGAEFKSDENGGRFSLQLLGADVAIHFPEFEFESDCRLPPHLQALLVHHLAISDGSEPLGQWRAFADLPNGRFYASAFQGYTGDALVRRLCARAAELPDSVASLGGRALTRDELATNADAAWAVAALPRVPIAILWWDADDEFSARAELLFDKTASSHLPIDGCAVLGSWLTSRLVAEVESRSG